jgi:hypothetical protein
MKVHLDFELDALDIIKVIAELKMLDKDIRVSNNFQQNVAECVNFATKFGNFVERKPGVNSVDDIGDFFGGKKETKSSD